VNTPRLIAPPPGGSSADADIAPARRRALPPDLLREAARRLGITALVGAVLWTVGTVLAHIALHALGIDTRRLTRGVDAIAAVAVVVSIALFVYTRRSHRDPRFMLDLGLVYMVFAAFCVGITAHWGEMPQGWPIVPMISWIGVIILIFAAIVPSTPGKTFVAALIAASMNPLGMLIGRARGEWTFDSGSTVVLMHYPDYLLVGVAVVISYVLTRLGQQLASAREMGSYRLGRLLGSGGMGQVYEATHRMLARRAAIKLIRPEMISAVDDTTRQLVVKRFHREAEAAASLRSPHTVELYDFGVTDDQTLYFVMELLEGTTLETLVREHGPLPAGRVVHILLQVCESLEEAHQRGLVHRDIKPANIHLGRAGLRADFVKVLDFGLVKSVASAGREESLATAATASTPGTPAYMAPEMVLDETVDGRADVYALGCVAYYLLTGRVVFEADNVLQMLAKHLRVEPARPSTSAPARVPAELDELVLACLAKRAEDRPQSAGEVARALAAIEVEPWTDAQAMEWWKLEGRAAAR
jgi:serine/threonine-protein kinase